MIQDMKPKKIHIHKIAKKIVGLSTVPRPSITMKSTNLWKKSKACIWRFETITYKQTMLLIVLICLLEVPLAGTPKHLHSSRSP